MRLSSARPVLTETVGQSYRIALYRPAGRPPVIVADPLLETRSLAVSAQVVWQRHLRGERLAHWVEPVSVRRKADTWPDRFIHVLLSEDESGAMQVSRWKRVTQAEVAQALGSQSMSGQALDEQAVGERIGA